MLWEQSGVAWRINNVRTNSSMQLFTHDLTEKTQLIFFNKRGREAVLDAAPQEPWAATGSTQSS